MDKHRYREYRWYLENIRDCINTMVKQIGCDERVVGDEDIVEAIMLMRDLWNNTRQEAIRNMSQSEEYENEFLGMLKEDK